MTQSRKRLAHVVLTTVAICVGVFAATAPAQAGVGLSVTPDIVPNPAVVGDTNLPANLRLENASTGSDAQGSATLTRIQLTLSCGDQGDAAGNCSAPDPGVFQPGSTAHGVGGSCVEMNFNVAPDPVGGVAAGRYLFALTSEGVTLGPVGTAMDFCEIAFTVDVLKVPTIDARPAVPGVQTFTPAYAEGVLTVPGNPGSLDINGNGRDETRVDEPLRDSDRQERRADSASGAGWQLHVHAGDLQPGSDGADVDHADGLGLWRSVHSGKFGRQQQHLR